MSTISTASAAFYQFFRDREGNAAFNRAGDGGGPAQVATTSTIDPGNAAQTSDDGRATAPTALTPAQVRTHLETLISAQVVTGKLTGEQAATLRQSLGPDASAVIPGTQDPAPATQTDGAPTELRSSTDAVNGTYKPSEVLAAFIQNVKSSQASGSSYGSTGAAPPKATKSQLLDFDT